MLDGGFKRGAGGVITGLLTLADATGADWVACARNDAERELAAKNPAPVAVPLLHSIGRLHYATPSREQYEMYYAVFANPVLWFIQHYLWDLAIEPVIDDRIHQAWEQGYVEVNRQMAAKTVEIARAARARPLVMVHDYQLYLVPRLVRKELPDAVIQHFVHVPWPTPQYWKVLPKHMRDAILEGLLGCDIVGFQSSLDVRNFLLTCEENAGLQVDERERAVMAGGRVVYARHYPRRGASSGRSTSWPPGDRSA
jgi:trehalose 6-phosphate synthase